MIQDAPRGTQGGEGPVATIHAMARVNLGLLLQVQKVQSHISCIHVVAKTSREH